MIPRLFNIDEELIGPLILTPPVTAEMDGQVGVWRITQGAGGPHTVTLDGNFNMPISWVVPLPWSIDEGLTDYLTARYRANGDKWDVIAFIPGFS